MAKVIYNKYIPFKGFKAIALVWLVFVRDGSKIAPQHMWHINIHLRQQREMLVIFFFLWYGIEWLIRLIQYRNTITAYKNISFEREAYSHQGELDYLDKRKPYSFVKYVNTYGSTDNTIFHDIIK